MTGEFLPLHRARTFQVAAASATLAFGFIGFFPLFAGPTYEAALAAGLILPAFAAAATAVEVSRVRPTPLSALGRGLAVALALAALGLLVAWVQGLRVGLCNPIWGTALFALGPASGALLGGAWGAAAGLLAERVERRRRQIAVAVALSLLAPLAGIVVSIVRFYTSPMVFAYDPFFGFFAGTLYDTIIEPLRSLLTYRAGTALTLAAAAVVAVHLRRTEQGRLRFGFPGRPFLAVLGALALSGSVTLTLFGSELGHYSTAGTIRETLGRALSGKRCDLIYSRGIFQRDARLLLRECDAHVVQLESFFGARGPERIKVYLFASPAEKGRLMGASNTYIAKPWRSEIYLQLAGYPHPVLGHELAHVIAGAFGRGPFLVSGPLGGWLPDPGRIEGVAVAASPAETSPLGLQQWAKSLLSLGLLPELKTVFRLSFLGENSSKAYMVAGAFIDWFRSQYGAEKLRRWYGGERLEELTGAKLAALDEKWRASLGRISIPERALHSAKARFDRPGLFARQCPHAVDELNAKAHERLGVNDHQDARRLFERLLNLDPRHFQARVGLALCAQRAGNLEEARLHFERLSAAPDLHHAERLSGLEALGDMALRRNRVEAARAYYARVTEAVVDEDHLRTLSVKSAPLSEIGRRAIVSLLIGEPELGASWDVAAAELGEWYAREPEQGLPAYLLGKNLFNRGRWQEAARYLDRALERELELPLVRKEAERTRLLVACAEGNLERAREVYAALSSREDPGWRREGLRRFAQRCGVEPLGTTRAQK